MSKNKYPSVGHLGLSEKRKKGIKKEIKQTFEKYSIINSLASKRDYKLKLDKKKKFLKLGINSIIDKIFFVDLPDSNTRYSYRGIGFDYGKSVADGELKLILHKLNKLSLKEKLEKDITEQKLKQIISNLIKEGKEPNVILTNIYDEHKFYYMDSVKTHVRSQQKGLGNLVINNSEIRIFSSFLVKPGFTYIFNKDTIKLVVKKPLSIKISEINEREKRELKKKFINKKEKNFVKKIDFNEKIRVLVYEIINVFPKKEEITLIKSKNTIKENKKEIKDKNYL